MGGVVQKFDKIIVALLATASNLPALAQDAGPQANSDMAAADIGVTGLKASLQNNAQIRKNTREMVDDHRR